MQKSLSLLYLAILKNGYVCSNFIDRFIVIQADRRTTISSEFQIFPEIELLTTTHSTNYKSIYSLGGRIEGWE